MADITPTTPVILTDNPAIGSKINWAQYITFAAGIFAYFGWNLTPERQMMLLQFIVLVAPVITWIFRTWFTGRPATVPQMTAAIEDKGHEVTVKPVKPERHVYKRSEDGGRR